MNAAPLNFFRNAQLTVVRIIAIAAFSFVCLLFVIGLAFYAGDDLHVATPILVTFGVAACAGYAIWKIPTRVSAWKASLVLTALCGLCISTLISAWASKGRVTFGRSNFTLIAACPVPYFDFRVSAGGSPWFRKKSATITAEEIGRLAEGADCVIVGIGIAEKAVVESVTLAVPVEVLETKEAYARHAELRRAGKAAALIAHTK